MRATKRKMLENRRKLFHEDRERAVDHHARLVKMRPEHKGSYDTQLKVLLGNLDKEIEALDKELNK